MVLSQPRVRADEPAKPQPDFKEVYDLVRTNLADESEKDLNHDSVEGLIKQLNGKIALVSGEKPTNAVPALDARIYDGSIACFRVHGIEPQLAGKIRAEFDRLAATNQLKGVVLDLRYSDGTGSREGDDYTEAAKVADLFITREKPLLDAGTGMIDSVAKTNAITLPLILLVNTQSSGAAEALAAMLREDDRAILIGSTTAGHAALMKNFPLKDGEFLRIATGPIRLGDGQNLSEKGVRPDISVKVSAEDQKAYFNDPYLEFTDSHSELPSILGEKNTTPGSTNHVARSRPINETDLMRERKERPGVDMDELPVHAGPVTADSEKPVVRDPVLGRALDLIKGISTLRRASAN